MFITKIDDETIVNVTQIVYIHKANHIVKLTTGDVFRIDDEHLSLLQKIMERLSLKEYEKSKPYESNSYSI